MREAFENLWNMPGAEFIASIETGIMWGFGTCVVLVIVGGLVWWRQLVVSKRQYKAARDRIFGHLDRAAGIRKQRGD